MNSTATRINLMAMISLGVTAVAMAQYEISGSTIDGGGATIAGVSYSLSGTIGQADAQSPPLMSGGSYVLTGGFWPVTQVCNCPGDLTGDGNKDGRDVQLFINCIMSGGNCSCADMDLANGVTVADVPTFVSNLTSGSSCP